MTELPRFRHPMCRCVVKLEMGTKPKHEGQRTTVVKHGQIRAVDGNFDELVWKCYDCGRTARRDSELRKMACK